MSKKKNRPPSAQNLIDSLLDEKTQPKPKASSADRYVSREREAAQGIADDENAARGLPDPMDLTRSVAMDLQTEDPEIASSYQRGPVQSHAVIDSPRDATPERPRRPAPPPPPTIPSPQKTEPRAEPAPAPAPTSAPVSPVKVEQDVNDERTMRLDHILPKKSADRNVDRYPEPKDVDAKASGDRDGNIGKDDATSPLKTQGPQPILTRSEAIAKPAPFNNDTIDRMMPTEIKTRAQSSRDSKQKVASSAYADGNGAGYSSAEASLKQSESLRIAQKRITDLEQELERLRRENENLGTAGDTLRRRSDELLTKSENLEMQARENEKIHEEEKKVYRSQVQQKDRDLMEQRNRLEEMEGRLENNFKKIRVRERELEHRLEIIKMESATLVSGKDKMILDLKRQLDQLNHENDYGKQKSAELYNQYQGKQDTIRRVVRALRIALTILEGDEDASSGSSPRSSKRDE